MNKNNGKIYIGQCLGSAFDRWCRHKYDAHLNRYPSRLGNAIRKYGDDAFRISILANRVASKELLDYLEQYFIIVYDARNPDIGYNLTDGGDGSYGLKLSSEACAKMGKTKLGNKNCIGRIISDFTRKKISNSNKLYYASIPPEQRKKSSETRARMKAGMRGLKKSPEHCQKMRIANLGKHKSELSKQKQANTRFLNTIAWG